MLRTTMCRTVVTVRRVCLELVLVGGTKVLRTQTCTACQLTLQGPSV